MSQALKIAMLSTVLVFSLYGQDLGNLGSSNNIFKPAESRRESRSATKSRKSGQVKRTSSQNPQQKKVTSVKRAVNNEPKSKFSQQVSLPESVTISTGDYEELIGKGNQARDERQYVLAEESYRQATQIKPKDSRAFYGLGNIFSDQQKWEEAEKFYRKAIEIDPQSVEAYIALSFVLTQPIIGVNVSSRYMEAEKLLRKAILLSPSNPFAHDLLGVALELQGRLDAETESAYRRAIELDPNFALAYAHLARFLSRKGDKEGAKKAYAEALRRVSDMPTLILIAETLQSQQKHREAEQILKRVVRSDPKNPYALFLLGRALAVQNEFKEAENVLKQSIQLNPNNFAAYLQLVFVYTRQKNYVLAEETLEKASEVASANEKRRLAFEFEVLGDKLMEEGKRQEALRIYKKASAVLPGEKRLLDKLVSLQ